MDELAKKIMDHFKFKHHLITLHMSSYLNVITTVDFEAFEENPIQVTRDAMLRTKREIESKIDEDLKYLDSLEEERKR